MGVAWHEDILVFLAQRLETVEEPGDGVGYVAKLVAHEELEVDEHLVVARAPGVDFLSDVAEAGCQHELHLRVDILDAGFDCELASLDDSGNLAEGFQQHFEFLGAQQADAFEHPDVGHRALDVVAGETQVKLAVAADGELLYHFVRLKAFAPKFHFRGDMVFLWGILIGLSTGSAFR